jgi:hypothetical protein
MPEACGAAREAVKLAADRSADYARRSMTDSTGNGATGAERSATVDVAIIGGGIAGLWLANLLTARGYGTGLDDDLRPAKPASWSCCTKEATFGAALGTRVLALLL